MSTATFATAPAAYPERPAQSLGEKGAAPRAAFVIGGLDRLQSMPRLLAAIRRAAAGAGAPPAGMALQRAMRQPRIEATLLLAVLQHLGGIAERAIGLRPHPVQIAAAVQMLAGKAVEMETGEGKTLVAALVASVHALAGRSVHVVTTNDYLANRDAAAMRPLFAALDVSSDAVLSGMDDDARRRAYRAQITYVTAKNLMFDYLRDRIALGDRATGPLRRELAARRAENGLGASLFLRGLQVAIVDEADSIFIDDAAVPLIISQARPVPEQAEIARTALRFARMLAIGRDYIVEPHLRQVALTDAGRARLASIAPVSGAIFANPRWRDHYVGQALAALHVFVRDRDYIIQDGNIQTVDAGTGRALPDRSWERGLHQMIQAKEDLPLTVPSEAAARISHLAFFRRYQWLTGMSGTLLEARREIRDAYGLDVVRIPTNRPLRRRNLGTEVFDSGDARMAALVRRIASLQGEGRPVLVGTRSVSQSEVVSRALAAAGIAHRLLNARTEAEEAGIIAEAGRSGQVTVATAIAGRGTDIRLDAAASAAGGLHVIATERHDARRIDRQLFGRSGRQGDPGSYEEMLSLEDDIIRRFQPRWKIAVGRAIRLNLLRKWLFVASQGVSEREERRRRLLFIRNEQQASEALAFAGPFRGPDAAG